MSAVRHHWTTHQAKFEHYADLVLWWNQKLNLMSRSISKQEILKHIEHSLFPAQWIDESALPLWIDTGTGGGLPGIPLAIALPGTSFVLNDIIAKKMVAVKAMCRELNVSNVDFFTGDISAFQANHIFGLVTKHAFKMDDLLHRIDQKNWEKMVFLKGADYIEELKNISPNHSVRKLDLAELTADSFYQGKYIIELCRTSPTAPFGDKN